jgi:mono/diheme cytochrome c family protein
MPAGGDNHFMKRGRLKYVIVPFMLVFAASLIYGWSTLRRGFSAKSEPSSVETFVARRLRRLAIPNGARAMRNPVEANPEVVAAAKAHYADHCAICHGNDGRGTTLIGKGLYPKPPDMTQRDTQDLTDGELYYIVENGIRFTGMPGFGEEVGSDQNMESWQLIHFIRHLPAMSDEEVTEMKKMNPKSPMELAKEERMRRFLQGDDDNQPAEDSHEHSH